MKFFGGRSGSMALVSYVPTLNIKAKAKVILLMADETPEENCIRLFMDAILSANANFITQQTQKNHMSASE